MERVLFIFLFPSFLVAQTNTSTLSRRSYISPSQVSFIIPSFVIHGTSPSLEASQAMPRRMDNGGQTVVTPGLGVEYLDKESGWVFLAAMIKDCYDNLAGTVQVGKMMRLAQTTYVGFTLGVYARQTPLTCTNKNAQFASVMDTRGAAMETQQECTSMDDLSDSFTKNIGGHAVDIIPMPFLHFSTSLYKTREMQIDLKLMSNFFLNEVGFGIPF